MISTELISIGKISWTHINRLETMLPMFDHQLGDLQKKLEFGTLALSTMSGNMTIKVCVSVLVPNVSLYMPTMSR